MTVGMHSATVRIIVLVAMVLSALFAPVGVSLSHVTAYAVSGSADHDGASLDHGHTHDDEDDDQGAGHGHRHNPADHSHVTAGLVGGDYAVLAPRFGRDWSGSLCTLVMLDRLFSLERPPRGLIAA